MEALWIFIAMVFVLGVLVFIAYGVFELTPFARHSDRLRDPHTGRRLGESPHMETRDDYERAHPA
jgi:hypothetical protein